MGNNHKRAGVVVPVTLPVQLDALVGSVAALRGCSKSGVIRRWLLREVDSWERELSELQSARVGKSEGGAK